MKEKTKNHHLTEGFMKKIAVLSAVAAMFLFSCGENPADNGGGYKLTTIITGGGSVTRNPDKLSYESGENVTLTASPAAGYLFDGWTGASTSMSATVTVVMNGNKTLTANFAPLPTYTLTASAYPAIGGSVTVSPSKISYAQGETVTVTATAATGYKFNGWSGASTSTAGSVTVNMNGDKALTANFVVIPTYTLTTSAYPTIGGTITVSPNKTSYTEGESVNVSAVAASGYMFIGWSGASSATTNSTYVIMNGNKTLTANFAQIANAVIITLTYWETKETDLLGDRDLDPRIYFQVNAVQGTTAVSRNTTGDLLNRDNIGQSWSGNSKSLAIPFVSQADELDIFAVVIEKDPLASDDISPGYGKAFYLPVRSGTKGSATMDYSGGKSKVSFDYEFIWQQ
jgi:uncharacterized repeat protein (TIGR02543 family)